MGSRSYTYKILSTRTDMIIYIFVCICIYKCVAIVWDRRKESLGLFKQVINMDIT